MINITNEDNMLLMARYPDNYFDLAIVDPPYGIKENSNRKNLAKGACKLRKEYNTSLWSQEKPTKEYWLELFRVSKNQIIWGGNYFTDNLPETRCWIVWNKYTQDSNFADIEMAWTSFNKSSKLYDWRWNGMLQQDMKNKEERIHPTQKPIGVYSKIINDFCNKGEKIIDTHIGSGSIAISLDKANKFEKMNLTLIGCELVEDHFKDALKRIKQHTAQQTIF